MFANNFPKSSMLSTPEIAPSFSSAATQVNHCQITDTTYNGGLPPTGFAEERKSLIDLKIFFC
jgi:hypothetical protein